MGNREGKRPGRRVWLKRTALAPGALQARAAHGAPGGAPARDANCCIWPTPDANQET